MARSNDRTFVLLWSTVVVVGVLLMVVVAISVRVADMTNRHLVRHRAFSVMLGMRFAMRARGPAGLDAIQSVIPLLKRPGILQIGLVGPDMRYVATSNPAQKGKRTVFKVTLKAMARRGEASRRARWHGRAVRVFAFAPRPPGRMVRWMHRRMPFVLEVVVDTSWPAWLRTWIALILGTGILALMVLILFAWRLQTQARRASRLEAEAQKNRELRRLGELSAMVAHQLRNPLAGLKGNLQLGIERLNAGRQEEAMDDLLTTLDSIQRIEDLVKNLLAFTRDMEPKKAPTDMAGLLGVIVEEMDGMSGVQVTLDASQAGTCPVDRELVRQAVQNLVQNAMDSGAHQVHVSVQADADGCIILVEDDGPGLDDAVATKVFEPFVSTRSKGTGLGLAMVDKVVRAHGGRVEAGRSERLGGALFRMTLPGDGR